MNSILPSSAVEHGGKEISGMAVLIPRNLNKMNHSLVFNQTCRVFVQVHRSSRSPRSCQTAKRPYLAGFLPLSILPKSKRHPGKASTLELSTRPALPEISNSSFGGDRKI